VEHIVGIPDYESLFKAMNFNTNHADGITAAQEIRLTADPIVEETGENSDTSLKMFYGEYHRVTSAPNIR